MVDVGSDEALLLFESRVARTDVACKGRCRIVVVVCPFGEMVGEFKPGQIGRGIFKINDHKLFVLVLRLEKRGALIVWLYAQDIAVLSLSKLLVTIERGKLSWESASHIIVRKYEPLPNF